MCPFYGYRHPCLFELKKGKCKALHLETVRDIFELQREIYNSTKNTLAEEDVEEMIADKEQERVTPDIMQIFKGLIRNYPAKPKEEDVIKAKRL